MAEPITTVFRVDIEGAAELAAYTRALEAAGKQIDVLDRKKAGPGIDSGQVNAATSALDKLDKVVAAHGKTTEEAGKKAASGFKAEAEAATRAAGDIQSATQRMGQGVASVAQFAQNALGKLSSEMKVSAANTGHLSTGILTIGAAGGVAGMAVAKLAEQVLGLAAGLANAGREAQVASGILKSQLSLAGQAGNFTPVMAELKSMRAELLLLGATGADANVAFRRAFTDMGGNAQVALDAIRAALKVAAVQHEDFLGVVDGVGKAVDGQYKALANAGINFSNEFKEVLESIKDPAEKAKLIIEHMNAVYKDTATGTETLKSQQQQLDAAFKELNATVGKFTIGPATEFYKWLNDSTKSAGELAARLAFIGSLVPGAVKAGATMSVVGMIPRREPAPMPGGMITDSQGRGIIGGWLQDRWSELSQSSTATPAGWFEQAYQASLVRPASPAVTAGVSPGDTGDGSGSGFGGFTGRAVTAGATTNAVDDREKAKVLARNAGMASLDISKGNVDAFYKSQIEAAKRAYEAAVEAENEQTKQLNRQLDERVQATKDAFAERREIENAAYKQSQRQMDDQQEAEMAGLAKQVETVNRAAQSKSDTARASAQFAKDQIALREQADSEALEREVKAYEKATKGKLDSINDEVKARKKADDETLKSIDDTLKADIERRTEARDNAIAAINAVKDAEEAAHRDISRFNEALDQERRDRHDTEIGAIEAERDAALGSINDQLSALDKLQNKWSQQRAEREANRGLTTAEKKLKEARRGGDREAISAAEEDLYQAQQRQGDVFIQNLISQSRDALKAEGDRIKDTADARKRAVDEDTEITARGEKAKRQEYEDTYQARITSLNNAVTEANKSADAEITAWRKSADERKATITAALTAFTEAKQAEAEQIKIDHDKQVELYQEQAKEIRTRYQVQRDAVEYALRYQEAEIKAQHEKDIARLTAEQTAARSRWKEAKEGAEAAHTAIMAAIGKEETEFDRVTGKQRQAISDDHAAHQKAIKKTYTDPGGLIPSLEDAHSKSIAMLAAMKANFDGVKLAGDGATDAYKTLTEQVNKFFDAIKNAPTLPTMPTGFGSAPTAGGGRTVVAGSPGIERWRSQVEAAARQAGISDADMPQFVAAALAIIHHETAGAGDPNQVYNDDNGKPSVGLFKVNMQHGQSVEYWQNPQNNIQFGVNMLAGAWRGGARTPTELYTAPGSINPGATPDWSGWSNGRYAGGYPQFQSNINAWNQAYSGGAVPMGPAMPAGPATLTPYTNQSAAIASGAITLADGTTVDPATICGPIAVQFWSNYFGRPMTITEAIQVAEQNKGYSSSAGMSLGVNALTNSAIVGANLPLAVNTSDPWGVAHQQLGAGRPVTISTGGSGGHYFQVQGYDPSRGLYNIGASGQVVGLGEWATQQQIAGVGGVGVQGVIYDNRSISGGGKPRNKPLGPDFAATGYDPSEEEYLARLAAQPRGVPLFTMPADYMTPPGGAAAAGGYAPPQMPAFTPRTLASFGLQGRNDPRAQQFLDLLNALLEAQPYSEMRRQNQLGSAEAGVIRAQQTIGAHTASGYYASQPEAARLDQLALEQALREQLATIKATNDSRRQEEDAVKKLAQALVDLASTSDNVVDGLEIVHEKLSDFAGSIESSPFGVGGQGIGRAPGIWDALATMQKLTGGNGIFGGLPNFGGDLFNNPSRAVEAALNARLGLGPNGTSNYERDLNGRPVGNPFVGNAPGPINAGNIMPGAAPGGPSPFGPGTQGNISYAYGGWVAKGSGYPTGIYGQPTILVGDSPSGRSEAVISQDDPTGAARILSRMPPEFWEQLANLPSYNVPGPNYGSPFATSVNLNNLGPNTVVIEVDGQEIPMSIWQANIMGIIDNQGRPMAGWIQVGNRIRRAPAPAPAATPASAPSSAGAGPSMAPMAAWGVFNSTVTGPAGGSSFFGGEYHGGYIAPPPPPPTLTPPTAPTASDLNVNVTPPPTQLYVQVPVSVNTNVSGTGGVSSGATVDGASIFGGGGSSVQVVPPGQSLVGAGGQSLVGAGGQSLTGAGATIGSQLITASQIGATGNYGVLSNPITAPFTLFNHNA